LARGKKEAETAGLPHLKGKLENLKCKIGENMMDGAMGTAVCRQEKSYDPAGTIKKKETETSRNLKRSRGDGKKQVDRCSQATKKGGDLGYAGNRGIQSQGVGEKEKINKKKNRWSVVSQG